MPSVRHRIVASFVRHRLRAEDIQDAEQLRAECPGRRRRLRVPRGWRTDQTLLAFPALIHEPRDWSASSGTLLYLHGGAYVEGPHRRQLRFTRRLATQLGVRVVLPRYPLAPEHTWRDSRDALIALAGELAAQGQLLLAGDSAGGGYAFSIAQGMLEAGHRPPERMVLISPWVDLSASAPGMPAVAGLDPWLRLERLDLYAGWWAGTQAERERLEVSPALGPLDGLPPTLAMVGTHDLLHPENVVLAERAAGSGWALTLVQEPGLIHVYPLLPVPEAARAYRQITTFLGGLDVSTR